VETEIPKSDEKYKQIKLLILDEYLLFPLKESEARDLLEIVKRGIRSLQQYSAHSLPSPVVCQDREPTLSDAICDRIVHNSYTIKIDGDSMRKRKSISE